LSSHAFFRQFGWLSLT